MQRVQEENPQKGSFNKDTKVQERPYSTRVQKMTRVSMCFLSWEYSVDDEKKQAVYDGGGAAYWMSVKI
ncbi:unnamed protein product [Porites lobata]|uniref:Uncharacterized protein n=1 Tax=Porites lobata TaxID=104759 RepID=A0ABN8SCW5_9CNID|nr:unnamed protein product [Porites lobata]